jgi:hypothetical protein
MRTSAASSIAPIALAAMIASLTGCERPLWRLFSKDSAPKTACRVGDSSSCPVGETCVLSDPPVCVKQHSGPTPLVQFPFKGSDPVVCARGTRTGSATSDRDPNHASEAALYAIDLRGTGAPSREGPEVFSGTDGTAVVLEHHVLIASGDGLSALYANLAAVFVKDGQQTRTGDRVGRAGASGLHFSVHSEKIASWVDALASYRAGRVPPSIAYETLICDPAHLQAAECLRKRVNVTDLPCGPRAPELRGDWR